MKEVEIYDKRAKKIKAEIIADSINPNNERITTFIIDFPRIVLSEFNTHRVLSRNSSSSRAITYEKNIDRIKKNTFYPYRWLKAHKGMQGYDYFNKDEDIEYLDSLHQELLDTIISYTDKMNEYGVSKQLTNRYLEPFSYQKVIVTATDYQNFFKLRNHPEAENHIALVAAKMMKEYNDSTPVSLDFGQWHIPFGDMIDDDRVKEVINTNKYVIEHNNSENKNSFVKQLIATARSARVSYFNFEGKDDYNADVNLFKRLEESGHWSPFEHVARAIDNKNMSIDTGNIKGWLQLRKHYINDVENQRDNRIENKKHIG